MVIAPFEFGGVPKIRFGCGVWKELPDLISRAGHSALILTGSLQWLASWPEFCQDLDRCQVRFHHFVVRGEPTPARVDCLVEEMRGKAIEVVVSIGGGSVIDAGKAVSAMLPSGEKVQQYLEGVGSGRQHDGRKVPFIAVPTTAGTGSEATRNAVLGQTGPNGFKRSLRHEKFVPDHALVDPELTFSCPPAVTAACGLDALTQLLEAYVSSSASPMTDCLAWEGLKCFAGNPLLKCAEEPSHIEARTALSCAALLSGIVLANAGLGVVHGLAAPIGGFFDIPHGVVCGTLLAESVRITLQKLADRQVPSHPAILKYQRVSHLLFGGNVNGGDPLSSAWKLADGLEEWLEKLHIPSLGRYGVSKGDIPRIVAGAGSKNHPVPFTHDDMGRLIENRIQ